MLFLDGAFNLCRATGWLLAPRKTIAIEPTSGRQRLNIHGALNLETGETRIIEAETIDAASTIQLLESLEALYPMLAVIDVYLDICRYHHAKLVQDWRPSRAAGSSCTSSLPIARTSAPSSGSGADQSLTGSP